MAEESSWWDRDPIKLWAPLAALFVALLQTAAYAGYQVFYGAFGVAADEVGFDYSSILRRTSVTIAISFITTVLLLSILTLLIPFGVKLYRAGEVDNRSRALTQPYPDRAGWQAGLIFVWLLAAFLAGA